MAEYLVHPCRTVKSNLNRIPVVGGQWIIVTDTFQQYYDVSDSTRIEITNILILDTDADRLNILAPINTFYFVISSKMLWFYNFGWIPVGVSDANNISFTPPEGVSSEINTVQLALTDLFNTKISCNSSAVTKDSIAIFDSTTGNSIIGSQIRVVGGRITNVSLPVSNIDVANKEYVDNSKSYIESDNEPTNHNKLWIKSSNKVIHYYDVPSSSWVPIRGVTG